MQKKRGKYLKKIRMFEEHCQEFYMVQFAVHLYKSTLNNFSNTNFHYLKKIWKMTQNQNTTILKLKPV